MNLVCTSACLSKCQSENRKAGLLSRPSNTFYNENSTKFFSDTAPQTSAYQPHTVWLLRFCIVQHVMTIAESLSPASHQYWGHRKVARNPQDRRTRPPSS